jgi:hypothetical protein
MYPPIGNFISGARKKRLKKVKINLPNPKTPLEFKISKVMYNKKNKPMAQQSLRGVSQFVD